MTLYLSLSINNDFVLFYLLKMTLYFILSINYDFMFYFIY